MKRTISIIALCLAALMIVSLCACGEKKDEGKTRETTAAAATTAPTTAATVAPVTPATQGVVTPTSGDQGETASPEQQEYMDQQKAIQNAITRTEELYGQGEWGVSSFEAATAPDGAQGYYIGIIDYSDPNSPIYYFYAGALYCYEAENQGEAYPDDEQQEYMDQQKAIQSAISRTEELYGQGEWGVAVFQPAVAPDGASGYYIGITDYSDVNSPIYYFYAGYQFCYEA